MDGYTLLGLKLAMGIIGLVLQINLMGKGNLAPTSAMDQVQNYVLGGIIGGVIYSDSIGVFQFSLVLVLWTLLVFTLRFIKNHNKLVKSLIDGKPVWVISYGDDNLRYPLIVDGQLDDDVLDIIDRDEEWVKAELEKQNITIEQVYIGEYLNGQLVAHSYENK